MQEKGGISVQTEHIFPIIKRWLYSEKDIFLRELVSNASDAVTKLKHLSAIGETQGISDDFKITVTVNKKDGTLSVEDNGIGMSGEEVKKYINQIALSGALDFIQKYDNSSENTNDGIIGHFGLGFYSAFMVADKVVINTKSYTDEPSVYWEGTDEGEFEMKESDRADRGTEIILYINEDNKEYLEKNKIKEILDKYCSFMPVPIFLVCDDDKKDEENKEEDKPEQINDTEPLWQKNPSQCTDEDYDSFYHKVFHDFKEPLFHIHINADYPLNFKGILYFPKLGHEYENLEGQVKLYYNRVFVADNIKEVIPEYLLMLKGVLDCPELPLNVSRSYLQNSSYVSKLSQHIVKKVCDKLISLHDTDIEKYKSFWDDIKVFVEYACLRDKKFYDRVKDVVLFKTVDSEYMTLKEYTDKIDEEEKKVYYSTDPTQQTMYINLFKNEGITVLLLDHFIDTNFISVLEQNEKGVKFLRIDSNADALKSQSDIAENEDLKKLFVEISKNEKLKVEFAVLKDEKIPAILNISEESRRFAEMMKMYAKANKEQMNEFNEDASIVLNLANPLIKKLEDGYVKGEIGDSLKAIAKQIYTLALIGQRQLTADELNEFLNDSYNLLEKI